MLVPLLTRAENATAHDPPWCSSFGRRLVFAMPKPCRRKVFQIPCTALSAEATARWLSVRFVFLEGHTPRMMRETAYMIDVIRDSKCVVSPFCCPQSEALTRRAWTHGRACPCRAECRAVRLFLMMNAELLSGSMKTLYKMPLVM